MGYAYLRLKQLADAKQAFNEANTLHENAITELILAAQLTGAEFIYSDEDFIHPDGYLCNPYFKPDFSPDLLLSHNYITHMVLVTKKLFEKVGGFRPGGES